MKGAIDLRIYLATTSRVVRKEQTKIMGDSVIVLQKGDHCTMFSLGKSNNLILLSKNFKEGGGGGGFGSVSQLFQAKSV